MRKFFTPRSLYNRFFWLTVYVFTLGLLITYRLFLIMYPLHDPGVLGRSYPVQNPDIHANEGGTVRLEGMIALVEPATFEKDTYLRVDRVARKNPIEVEGMWQVSDVWEARFRFHENDNDVKSSESRKPYILSFPYEEMMLVTDQGVRFDENTLKLARGETISGPWHVIDNSVVDVQNNTVSVVTNMGGFIMIVGGYHSTTSEPTEAVSDTHIFELTEPSETNEPAQEAAEAPSAGPNQEVSSVEPKESGTTVRKIDSKQKKTPSIFQAVSDLGKALKNLGSSLFSIFR